MYSPTSWNMCQLKVLAQPWGFRTGNITVAYKRNPPTGHTVHLHTSIHNISLRPTHFIYYIWMQNDAETCRNTQLWEPAFQEALDGIPAQQISKMRLVFSELKDPSPTSLKMFKSSRLGPIWGEASFHQLANTHEKMQFNHKHQRSFEVGETRHLLQWLKNTHQLPQTLQDPYRLQPSSVTKGFSPWPSSPLLEPPMSDFWIAHRLNVLHMDEWKTHEQPENRCAHGAAPVFRTWILFRKHRPVADVQQGRREAWRSVLGGGKGSK